jgi:hypothetical protein
MVAADKNKKYRFIHSSAHFAHHEHPFRAIVSGRSGSS